jgi:hypothetical protein
MSDQHRAALHLADWRFLLPAPTGRDIDLLIVPGAGEDMRQLLSALSVASEVRSELTGAADADAVVLLAGAPALDPLTLRKSLRMGGVLYMEFRSSRPLFGCRGTLRRQLEKSGFSGIRSYAVAPHPAQARVYAPLDAPSAIRWYGRAAYDPPTRLRELVRTGIAHAPPRVWLQMTHALPWRAVTARAGDSSESDGPAILQRALGGSGLRLTDFYPLLLADTGNRVVMLPFEGDASQPTCVMKIPKVPQVNDRTRNEHNSLMRVRTILSEDLRTDLPEPIALIEDGRIAVGVESYLPGASLRQRTTAWWRPERRKVENLASAADWLARFHAAATLEHVPWQTAADLWVHRSVESFRNRFGTTGPEKQLFDMAEDYARVQCPGRAPVVWQHRDFNIWNVVAEGQRLRVLDWEGLKPGPPACDLFHFSTHWYEALGGARTEEARRKSFERLWLDRHRGRAVRGVHAALDSYLRMLAISPRLKPLLLLYTWIELALRRSDQQRDQGISTSSPREGNRNFAYLEILARGADRLFEGGA